MNFIFLFHFHLSFLSPCTELRPLSETSIQLLSFPTLPPSPPSLCGDFLFITHQSCLRLVESIYFTFLYFFNLVLQICFYSLFPSQFCLDFIRSYFHVPQICLRLYPQRSHTRLTFLTKTGLARSFQTSNRFPPTESGKHRRDINIIEANINI